jgi:hypothetical protein
LSIFTHLVRDASDVCWALEYRERNGESCERMLQAHPGMKTNVGGQVDMVFLCQATKRLRTQRAIEMSVQVGEQAA